MKFPLSLLKQFLDTDADLGSITTTLTRIGLEVEGVEDKSAALAPFEVAKILHAEKHPDADKLKVCKVQTSAGEQQIVCGAPNARTGIYVALAKVDSIIPTNGMKIKPSKIRGVESNGMLCSAAELGLSKDHEGIIELPGEPAIGASIVSVLNLDDPVIELSITPNRGDCFGVLGIARDLAAAGIGNLKPLTAPHIATGATAPLHITIEDNEACPAFIGRRIEGVKNGPAPEWMQRTLAAAGMRSISTLVDITNFFTLAYGRPLHVFDADKVKGALTLRKARSGETLAALNDVTYHLTENDCVIADDSGAISLGGVMGGEASGVSDDTTNIVLETAYFDPVRVAESARHHQILSDARTRFERGVDPAFLATGEALATALILELCGGKAGEAVFVGEAPTARPSVPFDAAFITRLSGLSVEDKEARDILAKLGFTFNGTQATPPSWRHDVSMPADLAEDVLRIIGYDAIPTVSLEKTHGNDAPALSPKAARLSKARRVLATRGLFETISYAFISKEESAHFAAENAALNLQNPIAEQLGTMRPNLLPGLMRAAKENIARGQKQLRLFEVGSCFASPEIAGETTHITGFRIGNPHPHWQPEKADDLFTVKEDISALLALFGLNPDNCQLSRDVPGWYHPGRAGAIKLGPKVTLGYFGELHPRTLKTFDIQGPAYAFELLVDHFPPAKPKKKEAVKLSDYQPVSRDFAFVIDASMQAEELLKMVKKEAKAYLRDAHIFDVYAGKGVPEGKCSIALGITLQADDKTLSEDDIAPIYNAIIAQAEKLGAQLRG